MPLPVPHRQSKFAAADAWFAGAAGQALLASEADCVRIAGQQWPGQPHLWLGAGARMLPPDTDGIGMPLRLYCAEKGGWAGDLCCDLPLPVVSESCACVIVQHALDASPAATALLQECARILLPGGSLWLLALNPISPYRLRWQGQGLVASEPIRWRRRLRAAGLNPEPISQGVGPTWNVTPVLDVQEGAGLRAAFLLRAHKRRLPMTPMRKPRALGWRPEVAA
jgi:SAM-dependent methyltransferase